MQTQSGQRTSRRRGNSRSAGRAAQAMQQLPWQQLRNPLTPVKVISDDQLESIHHASLDILEQVGIKVLLPEARDIMRQAGAKTSPDSEQVYFDREMIESLIALAPAEFTLHARNPAHNLRFGSNYVNFGTVASAPNASCMDKGRRAGNRQDYQDFLRLAQHFNIIHFLSGYPVEPVDVHPGIRHLDCLADAARLTDKVMNCYSLGVERNQDAIEIARIARGISHEQLDAEPSLFTIINTNSPLALDIPMLQGIMEMAKRNQVVVITPFTLAGAMAPVTLAGALAQQNAEALAGLCFAQMIRPGAPVVYGGFTSNVDMKSGSPAFGTPEYMQAAQIGGQLARRYNLPYRSSNVNAANTVDAQAGIESTMAMWGALGGEVNLLMHGAGWMEGGLCASFEKFVLDVDLLQMMASYLKPPEVSDASLAVSTIAEVGPGGHFFGCAHTMERYENAFYAPLISDWSNYETWDGKGRPTAFEKANQVYKKALAEYQQPLLDPAIDEQLEAFISQRKAAGGVATDF